jgi:5S rRNA maturation endonuclease (ribonuclease M5)
MIPLEQLLSRLQNVRKTPKGWSARCPCHDDRRNSLSISRPEDGPILINCFAGCTPEQIVATLGLLWSDLFPDSSSNNGSKRSSTSNQRSRRIVEAYDYTDELGALLYQNVRYEPKDFRLRRPNGRGGWTWSLNGTRRVPYRLPELIEAIALEKTVFLVEGEKDAERLRSLGLAATTTGGAKSWKDEHAEFFRGAQVVIIPDRDRPGEDYARTAAQSLQGKAASVQVLILPLPWSDKSGLDVSDFLKEHSADELLALLEQPPTTGSLAAPPAAVAPILELPADSARVPAAPQLQRQTVRFGNSDELLSKELEPVRWVVPGILTEGLWLLCGKPKMGKSWLALSLCVASATGGAALGKVRLEPADVLCLPLEDNERRFKGRLEKLLVVEPAKPSLARLSYLLDCPRLDEGGSQLIEEWLKAHPGARLVVIDTLAKVRPLLGRASSLYHDDYSAVQPLKALSDRYRVAILVIHHLRKASAEDVQDTINATTGLAGGVDGTLILQRARGRATATLHVDGRDVPEVKELAINWDGTTAQWILMGDAEEFRLSQAHSAMVAAIREARQPLGPKAILEALRENEPTLTMNAVNVRLHKMVRAGVLQAAGRGRYTVPEGP